MPSRTTVPGLLSIAAEQTPGAVAIETPGERPALAFAQLLGQIGGVGAELRQRGVGQTDTVATIVPNGPEAATVFLSVASAAVCAPLNPAYGAEELEFYLGDLAATSLVISSEIDSPAREIARRRGITLIGAADDVFDRSNAQGGTCRRAFAIVCRRGVRSGTRRLVRQSLQSRR